MPQGQVSGYPPPADCPIATQATEYKIEHCVLANLALLFPDIYSLRHDYQGGSPTHFIVLTCFIGKVKVTCAGTDGT